MREQFSLGRHQELFERALAEAGEKAYAGRIWARDAALWKEDPAHQKIIHNALGWLTVAGPMIEQAGALQAFAGSARSAGFSDALLLGMGGSSLCPEVCAATFGTRPGFLKLTVLDTTDPASILSAERSLDLARTLFLVSSKSGGTIESACLQKYFYEKVSRLQGNQAGENFVAITDPGTSLEKLAREKGFRRTFLNPADIGGRYSALSYFGLVPMVLLGIDVKEILGRAEEMARRCRPPGAENPGLALGVALGALARAGRDKVTFVLEPDIRALGYWLEQLIAESTGKEGRGILPVEGEPLGDVSSYGEDRVFVRLGISGRGDSRSKPLAFEDAGHLLLHWELEDRLDLGAEFFLWEFATAVAGALLGINAFDQPNVQESKDNTQKLIREYLRTGRLEEGQPVLREGSFSLFCGRDLAGRLGLHHGAVAGTIPLRNAIGSFAREAHSGDYIAFLAYIQMCPAHQAALNKLRAKLRNRLKVATTLGFGPRFLHSTGQLHKGGANNGLFIQITARDREDVPIPGEAYSFGTLKKAQALGDLQSLQMHGRRALRLHIDGDLEANLNWLGDIVPEVL